MGRHIMLAACAGTAGGAYGQCTPTWMTFFPGADMPDAFQGPSQSIHFDDGSGPALYVAGDISRIGGIPARGIARWNGQSWSPLGLGLTGSSPLIRGLTVYDDDGAGPHPPRLCAVGGISSAGGVPGNNIAAWDGTVWTFIGTGVSSYAVGNALAAFDDDGPGPNLPSLYLGGQVGLIAGGSINGIARWTGTAWATVGGGVGGLAVNSVYALAVHDPDGSGPALPRLYAGGHFTTAGGAPANSIASWDGAAWSPLGAGANDDIYVLRSLDEDGDGPRPADLFVGGIFSQAGGAPASRIARWDGSLWSALGTGLGQGPRDIAVYDPDGPGPQPSNLYVCGYSLSAGGNPVNGIARWNGSAWFSVGGGVGPPPSGGASTLAIFDADAGGPQPARLYAGGGFATAGSIATNGIATWDGAAWAGLGPRGTPGTVQAMTPVRDLASSGTGLYIGGEFTVVGGLAASNIARWGGLAWLTLGSGVSGPVFAIAELDDDGPGPNPSGAVVGGQFVAAGGQPAANIARWTGSWSALGAGTDGPVQAIAVFDEDGAGPASAAAFAAGSFTHAGGASASRIARWDGAAWTPVGLGIDGTVFALKVADTDGPGPLGLALVAAGQFSSAGGGPAASISRWDGLAWSALGAGIGGTVHALTAAPPGGALPSGLYVGGAFPTAGGSPAANLARWDGTNWSHVGGGTDGPVRALMVHDDDRAGPNQSALFVGGFFGTAGGQPFANMAKWTGSAWASLGVGASGGVRSLALFDETGYGSPPVLFAGGEFASIDGMPWHSLARWGCLPNSTCYPNCDNSTTPPVLNVVDFGCFLGAMAAGSTYANCDQSTAPPQLNVLDYLCFLNAFAAGCP